MTHLTCATARFLRIALGVAMLSLVFVGPQTLWGLGGPVINRFLPSLSASTLGCGKRSNINPNERMTIMTELFLLPGNLVCDFAGVPAQSDHRQVLRSFINTIVWGAVATGAAIWLMV